MHKIRNESKKKTSLCETLEKGSTKSFFIDI